MPAIGNIALLDGKGTPATHTFAPVTTSGSVAKFANRAASIPQGFESLSVEVTTPATAVAAHRVKIKANFPVVAAVNGQDVVVRNSSFEGVFNLSQLSTSAERIDVLKLMANMLLHATTVAVVTNVEPIY